LLKHGAKKNPTKIDRTPPTPPTPPKQKEPKKRVAGGKDQNRGGCTPNKNTPKDKKVEKIGVVSGFNNGAAVKKEGSVVSKSADIVTTLWCPRQVPVPVVEDNSGSGGETTKKGTRKLKIRIANG